MSDHNSIDNNETFEKDLISETFEKDLIDAADKVDPSKNKSGGSKNSSESNFAVKLADTFQDEQAKQEKVMAASIEEAAKNQLREMHEKKLKDIRQKEMMAKQKVKDDEEKLRIKEEYESKVKARVLHWMQMELEENESGIKIFDPTEQKIVDREIKKRVQEQLEKIEEEIAREAEKKKREKEIVIKYEKLIDEKVSIEIEKAKENLRRQFDEDSIKDSTSLDVKKEIAGETKKRGGRNKPYHDIYYRWDGSRGGPSSGRGYSRGYYPDRRRFF